MKKLIFNKLYIFSTQAKEARCLQFTEGINVITTNQRDGTDRGKSVVMRSLYHALGADCKFDDKWDDSSKTYILSFYINDKEFFIYRNNRLFKFFDSDRNILFVTIDRKELAENLRAYFDFSVQLPNRKEDKLEITPPAFNYLLYFLDQDDYNGTNFSSFSNLGQYANYKENVIYYHMGVFNEQYFNLIKQLERLEDVNNKLEQRQTLVDNMLIRVSDELKGSTYSHDLSALNAEIEKSKEEYSGIVSRLNKVKQSIIVFKNQKTEFEVALFELNEVSKKTEKDIQCLNEHTCPYCKSMIMDTTELRSSKYNTSEDIIIVSSDVQRSILDIDLKIESAMSKYQELLEILKQYEDRLNLSNSQVNDVIRHKGYIEVRDNLLSEFGELKDALEKNRGEIDENKKQQRKYDAIKKEINSKYYEYLLNDKARFGLSEIDEKRFENINKVFSASGSNKPIATVMWYINLLKLKNKFNPNVIRFPIAFDSPNNVETDDLKRHELLEYLIGNATNENQFVISTIGFKADEFDHGKDCNIIQLDNDKYHLLNEDEFIKYSAILFEFCNKQ